MPGPPVDGSPTSPTEDTEASQHLGGQRTGPRGLRGFVSPETGKADGLKLPVLQAAPRITLQGPPCPQDPVFVGTF